MVVGIESRLALCPQEQADSHLGSRQRSRYNDFHADSPTRSRDNSKLNKPRRALVDNRIPFSIRQYGQAFRNMGSSRSKRRKRWFAAAAICLGFAVALLLCEVGLRVYVASRGWTPNCYATGLTFFVPDEKAGHTLRPNLRLRSSAYDIQTNSLGLRGQPIQTKKPEGVFRIAVLGGSSVFGYLVPEGQDSCCVLEELLRDRGIPSGKRVEVLNGGVPGFNMTQVRHRYEETIAPLDPDLVILYLGWNDSRLAIAESPQSINRTPPAPSWSRRLLSRSTLYGLIRFRLFPPDTPQFAPPADASTMITVEGSRAFRNDLQGLLSSVRRSDVQAVISTQLMAANPGCENLDRYLGHTPQQIETNQMIGRWITQTMRDVARESRVPLFDVAQNVACHSDLLGDAIHLTRDGHRQVAISWANDLARLLP